MVGTTSLENLKDLLGELSIAYHALCLSVIVFVEGVHLKLTDDEIKYLEEPYVPVKTMGFQVS